MKIFPQHIYTNPVYIKTIEWGRLITITSLSQIIVQGISIISGILIIRFLPTNEYALYILANTILGTMAVLADGGISIGVMSEGSKVWKNREKLGAVLSTGFYLRRNFTIVSIIVAAPLLFLLLQHHGANWLISILIILSLIPAFFTTLSGSLLEIVPKLWQDIVLLQKIQVKANIGRLILICFALVTFPWAFVMIIAAGLPQLWANNRLRTMADRYADMRQKPDFIVRNKIITILKRRLPDVIYFCFSSQITIWIISIIGSTRSVAQAGALGRLAVVINIFSVLFSALVLPRFARLPNDSNLLLKRYLQIQMGLIALSAVTIIVTWIFKTETLWILGKNYSDLTTEMILLIIGSCLNFIGWASNFLCTSRGWVINPIVSILSSIITIVIGALLIDISTLKGIFILNICISLTHTIMWILYSIKKISKVKVSL